MTSVSNLAAAESEQLVARAKRMYRVYTHLQLPHANDDTLEYLWNAMDSDQKAVWYAVASVQ